MVLSLHWFILDRAERLSWMIEPALVHFGPSGETFMNEGSHPCSLTNAVRVGERWLCSWNPIFAFQESLGTRLALRGSLYAWSHSQTFPSSSFDHFTATNQNWRWERSGNETVYVPIATTVQWLLILLAYTTNLLCVSNVETMCRKSLLSFTVPK